MRGTAVAPPGRHHGQHAEGGTEAEGQQHDDDLGGAPFVAEEPAHDRLVAVVQREGEQREEEQGPQEPDEGAHDAGFWLSGRLVFRAARVQRRKTERGAASQASVTGRCLSTASRSALPGLK